MVSCYLTGEPFSTKLIDETVPNIQTHLMRGRLLPVGPPAPLRYKTHFLPDTEFMRSPNRDTGKVVYLVRDPRDVLLSTIAFLRIAPQHGAAFARKFIADRGVAELLERGWGTWPEHVRGWTSAESLRTHLPDAELLVLRYEDLRAEPLGALERIVGFLGLGDTADRDRLVRALENTSLENMHRTERAEVANGMAAFRDAPSPQAFKVHQGRTVQSLAALGEDVEDAYLRLLEEDEEFAGLVREFGYEPAGAGSAGRAAVTGGER